LIEAVEKVGAYGGDQEKWALRVLQRVGQQGLKVLRPASSAKVNSSSNWSMTSRKARRAPTRRRAGHRPARARPVPVAPGASDVALLRRVDQAPLKHFGEHFNRLLAGHHGAEKRPSSTGAGPQAPLRIMGKRPACTRDDLPAPLLPVTCSQRAYWDRP
jgi:hypothetical protein